MTQRFVQLLVTLFFCSQIIAQEGVKVEGSINSRVFLSSDSLPFWLYSNTNGFVNEQSTFGIHAFAKASYKISDKNSLETGVSLFYRDGTDDNLQRGNLFISYKAPYYKITLGAKASENVNVLSTTNENVLLSGNARAFPGVVIEAPSFINLTDQILIDYALGHYILNDDRFVANTNVHYKRLNLRYSSSDSENFTVGVQHFAQWGGTSRTLGDLPDGLDDYFKIFLAQGGGEDSTDGEQVNALGNHLGSFDFSYEKQLKRGTIKAYHLHLFEDGSGTAFKNFPDGIWGAQYTFSNNSIFENILYEYVDTRSQSGSTGRSGRDNYFSNAGYRSGWTYEGQIIGLPFFELNPETGLGITNNRIIAHNIGVSGTLKSIKISGKVTYLQNLGTYAGPFPFRQKKLLSYVSSTYKTHNWGEISLLMGADFINNEPDNYALSIGYGFFID